MKPLKTLSAILIMAISLSASAKGKDYTPTTTWPYIYEYFQKGCVINFRGNEVHHEQLNISLVKGKVHYIQEGRIMEVEAGTIARITIGDDKYITVSGNLVKIIKETEHGITAVSTVIDADATNSQGMGYGGGSPVSSAWRVSANSLDGMVAANPQTISDISKNGGTPLTLKNRRGIVYNRMFIPASKPSILNIAGIDKDAVKKFMKDNKIKLTDDEDLSKLAEFIGTL